MALGLIVVVASCGMPARAQESGLTPREQQLLDTVQRLEQRVNDLEREVESLKRNEPAQDSDARVPEPASTVGLESRVSRIEEALDADQDPGAFEPFWKDGLNFASPDGRFKLRLNGRLQLDFGWLSADSELEQLFGDLEDQVEFRRSRIAIDATLYENVFFRMEYDFTGGDAQFKDVYVGMNGLPGVGAVTVGHFKEPFSLEQLTSDNDTVFIERSLLDTFSPERNTGAALNNTLFDQRATWAAGVYHETDDFGDGGSEGGYNVTGRVTALPWYAGEGEKLLHLGAAYSHRNVDGALRYRSRPEAHMTDVSFVDTLVLPVDDVDLAGGELALVYRWASIQGEYVRANVETRGFGDGDFDAWYALASVLLTGEHRPYDRAKGVLKGVRPRRNFGLKRGEDVGWGAWELALRFSNIDLNDGFWLRGGEEDNWTLGLNWYLNPNAKIMWNYIHGDVHHDLYSGDVDALTMRFQVTF